MIVERYPTRTTPSRETEYTPRTLTGTKSAVNDGPEEKIFVKNGFEVVAIDDFDSRMRMWLISNAASALMSIMIDKDEGAERDLLFLW